MQDWGIYKQRDLSGELIAVQVIPGDDLEDHVYEGCACSPRREETSGSPLVIHNSFDGRELKEKIILGRN